jgi:nucleotide-binding universal stress UspA family protein
MKIIVATDGSEFGTNALNFASRLVCEPNTEIEIVTVIEPAAGTEFETIIESVDELTSPDNPDARAYHDILESDRRRLGKKCEGKDITVSTKVLAGPAARAIVEEAEAWKADLIVVGSHGRGFWTRAWIGSVSDRIVRHAPCAVLTVR